MRASKGRVYVITAVAGIVLALALFHFIQFADCQNTNMTAYTPATRFNIPHLRGSIGFAYNGTYASATLQNDTWIFTGLTLNNSNILGKLNISVQDSNITIFTFYSYRQSSQFNR